MSEETAPVEFNEPIPMLDQVSDLPSTPAYVTSITFDAPNILLSASVENGITTKSVRECKSMQVPLTTSIVWLNDPVDERDMVFSVKSRNRVNFGGQIFDVINDAIKIGEVSLPATNPTAEEYLRTVGEEVMIHFSCERDLMQSARLGRPIYKVSRNFINLP